MVIGAMVKDNEAVPVAPFLSFTWMESGKSPQAVGVPEMAPVDGLRVNPVGSLLPVASAQVYGSVPPVATRVLL
jgi:hypothetical protein